MSILMLVDASEPERAVAQRLLAQGDEVRVLVPGNAARAGWRDLGVHVAVGDPTDDDLIERAGQNARTIVLFGAHAMNGEVAAAAAKAAAAASIERLILCGPETSEASRGSVRSSGRSYVILTYGRRLSLRGRAPVEVVAAAVDAADDLAGQVAIELDLREPDALALLGVGGPDHGP